VIADDELMKPSAFGMERSASEEYIKDDAARVTYHWPWLMGSTRFLGRIDCFLYDSLVVLSRIITSRMVLLESEVEVRQN
jgi:hypothetical protein